MVRTCLTRQLSNLPSVMLAVGKGSLLILSKCPHLLDHWPLLGFSHCLYTVLPWYLGGVGLVPRPLGVPKSTDAQSVSRFCVQLFATPWSVAQWALLSMGFSRPEYWRGLPFSSPGDLPDPGIKPGSPAL